MVKRSDRPLTPAARRQTRAQPEETTRFTLDIPDALDINLEAVARREGRRKKRIVADGLRWYLKLRKTGIFSQVNDYPTSDGKIRVTYLIPSSVNAEIQRIAIQEGRIKMRIVAEALAWYLRDQKNVSNPWRDISQAELSEMSIV